MKKYAILIVIGILVLFVVVWNSSDTYKNLQLEEICLENGFDLKVYAIGTDESITYLAKNETQDGEVKITCSEDKDIQFIEIEKNIYSIDDKLQFQDNTINLIVQIVNQYSNKDYDVKELTDFFTGDMKDVREYKEDMIVEYFGDDKYYSLQSINTSAQNYKEGNLILERFVISLK